MLYFVYYCFIAAFMLGVSTALMFKLIDWLTPMLPFRTLARKHISFALALVFLVCMIMFCLTLLFKAVSIRIVPIPR